MSAQAGDRRSFSEDYVLIDAPESAGLVSADVPGSPVETAGEGTRASFDSQAQVYLAVAAEEHEPPDATTDTGEDTDRLALEDLSG